MVKSQTMCGRYSIAAPTEILEEGFQAKVPPKYQPHYNAAPTQRLPVVLNKQPGTMSLPVWGIVPKWAKSPNQRLINARAETIAEKPTFKKSFHNRRCLVPANSYYEWQKLPGGKKQPYRIYDPGNNLISFAGLWEVHPEEGPAFIIVTVNAPDKISSIHDRMPAVLEPEARELWLSDTEDYESLQAILQPYRENSLQADPISTKVNNVRNEGEELWKQL